MSTIDPGVDEGIKESANDIERDKTEREHEAEEEQYFMQPSRWWFASTACPLLAGTFGPMASGFNICSLVYEWRQTMPPGIETNKQNGHIVPSGRVIPDPKWVIALNVVSLISALVGNASLLLNMARRLKFAVAQTITITGFFLAGVLLIADMVAFTSRPHYGITNPDFQPSSRHALTQAFYYAIFAASTYIILGVLMCVTVIGALKGHYKKEFHLTSSQRTLMLQTMFFIAYLLLGALVYSYIEGWQYLNAVYWADITLLTVGLGDYSPTTALGRGLLFPFAIGGILMLGLVVGSIRALILERGKQKISARIVEKRRSNAVHNVDGRKQTIQISIFARADFSTDPNLSPAQKREEEFKVMRQVQRAAERDRRWFALAVSSSFALVLWFVGAAIFQKAEFERQWTYLEALYFSYTSLLTIGYGTPSPASNSGRAFFVFWSLLAVPSLTILISNMGDTIVKSFSDLTIWVGSITVLPGEGGFRASCKAAFETFVHWCRESSKPFKPSNIFGRAPIEHKSRISSGEYEKKMLDRLAQRLSGHLGDDNFGHEREPGKAQDDLERDIRFYHYVLARECRNVQKDLSASPPKNYEWADWEYYLKLMGNDEDPEDFPGQQQPDILVPNQLRTPKGMMSQGYGEDRPMDSSGSEEEPHSIDKNISSTDGPASPLSNQTDGNVDRQTSVLHHMDARRKHARKADPRNPTAKSDCLLNWSWLSNESPLMSQKSEAEWILERLTMALERELNRQMRGYKWNPPISVKDARRTGSGVAAHAVKDSAEGVDKNGETEKS